MKGTAPASNACVALADARVALYSLINTKDNSVQDALNAKVQAASARVDAALAGMTNADDAKMAADFKAVWDQFKVTREKEIIPAIHAGNDRAIIMYSRNALDSEAINSRSASLTTLILVKSEELLSGVLVALEM